MTPFSPAHAEISLLVANIEQRAKALAASPNTGPQAWEDHRTNALREVWAAFDRIEPGLGLAYVCALYPELPGFSAQIVFDDVVNEAAQQARLPFSGGLEASGAAA